MIKRLEILDQLKRHIQSQGLNIKKDFPNLVYDIYSSLAHMSYEELKNIHFNNIVLEEFHRCGAKVWGECVNTILKNNSDAKVLGLSATPIRYLDHQKNMADELFYGNVASEISLSDAIADGILPMPITELCLLEKVMPQERNYIGVLKIIRNILVWSR